jgi:serine protease AprX
MNTLKLHNKLGFLIAFLLIVSFVAPVGAAPLQDNFASKISNDVLQATANGERTSFIIFLEDQADVSSAYNMADQNARGWYVYNTLTQHAALTQAPIIHQLEAGGVSYTPFWAANMIVAEGDRSLAESLAARPDVKVIESNDVTDWIQDEDTSDSTDDGTAVDSTTPGVNNVNAPQLWSLGYNGQGIVVANQDTGMRWTHTALLTKYRGWISGTTADHNYNWWDAIHVQLTGDGGTASPAVNPCGRNITAPCDDQGHGTHTTGTIVGDGGAGTPTSPNQIGVAPGAKWIGCRNMDSGNGRPSTYTECFQFFIAPTDLSGQNPDPARRPHVMNNSWGCPPSELCAANTLKTIVENTMAAGIFVVVSAGNDGSACSTVQDPPAIYASAFSVGAINGNTNALASFSSRGPVSVDGSGRMKPDLVAPGQTVRSSTRTSDTSYGNMSGTSMAGPHVVGSVALLWSSRPNLLRDIPRTEYLLTRSANRSGITVPNNSAGCGGIASTPNNHFGWGRVDTLAAYNLEPSLYQAITFSGLSDKTYGDPDFDVSATASSGLAVSFSASGNCTLAGATVHITGAGSCTITASQPGLDVYSIAAGFPVPYYPAADVSQSFSIAKATPLITWNDPANIVLGTPLSDVQLNATASVPGSFVYTPPAGTVLKVGAAQTLHVDFTPEDTANYTNASKDVTINVVFNFSGFLQPVDNLPVLNTANSGQAIPLKWRVTDVYGNPVTDISNVVVTAQSFACLLGATPDQIEEYAAGNSGFLNLGNGYYQFNWKTPKTYASSCKTMKLDLGEGLGLERTAIFQFTR